MRKIWYVSHTLTSTSPLTAAFGCLRSPHKGRGAIRGLGVVAVVGACGGPKPVTQAPGSVALVPGPERSVPTETTLRLVGSRCVDGACRCRESGANEEETSP